jgi:hypothetical protein
VPEEAPHDSVRQSPMGNINQAEPSRRDEKHLKRFKNSPQFYSLENIQSLSSEKAKENKIK